MNSFQVITVAVAAAGALVLVRIGAEVFIRWIESKGHDGL